MTDSILNNTKRVLGLQEDYDAFDADIILHINSVFGTLNQLGIGPEEGFLIEDAEATWSTFLAGDKRLNPVKTYVYLRVRLLFDPPNTAYLVSAMQDQIREMEWRLNVQRESTLPRPVLVLEEIDG